MLLPKLSTLASVSFFALAPMLAAEETGNAVNANGMLVAENSSAIEQARILRDAASPSIGVDANGNALPDGESNFSDDDSFGTQQMLETKERPRRFSIFGGGSVLYTNNAELTRNHMEDDVFAVANAGLVWSAPIAANLEANIGGQASLFRYHKMSSLDFNSVGFGAGLQYTPPSLRGVSFFLRYDFTELFGRGGHQILTDHLFSFGVQKGFAFGRTQGVTFGATGMLDISDPYSAQRSQAGLFLNYHLQLARKLSVDVLARPAAHFYPAQDRTDFNSVISTNLRYRFSEFAGVSGFLSYSLNRSSDPWNDYNAFSTGIGLDFEFRF